MKIAIIGGGFYGCHLANEITKKNITVDLYEKEKDILLNAIYNNQHRLHLGYHYPRCDFTIQQAIRSFDKFLHVYGDCVDDIKNNYYIIHKDSKTPYQDYINKFSSYNLNFEVIDKNYLDSTLNTQDVAGVINTKEKKINLQKLINKLKAEVYLNNLINLHLNTEITEVSNLKEYDFIINASYTNPNLGLNNKKFDIKYELCCLLLLKDINNKFKGDAYTIMDGEYVSLYPADYKQTYTLSSVAYTPVYKHTDIKELAKNLVNQKNIDNIFVDAKKFIKFHEEDFKIIKKYITFKAKILNDNNDYRGSYIIKEDKVLSIMSGKISAVLDLEQEVYKYLGI
jgi:hypothetical protein